ncbi:hypothetical protein [Chryseobacterium sp. JUb7]|uniref:hypothetical protein n=1 Tax=Chryseobacterium sp. JUb7 TaxID=2940599 RepID=UPI002168A104|nr:hypothetical protein [Chryseobacterium sp. JUb7]MCS3532067.1 hypothetical protein [Chryseobacterium sp. JUb7]
MNLEIKQEHQFYSKEHNIKIDFSMFDNNHPRLLVSQLEEIFKSSFNDWLNSSRTKNIAAFKSACYFDQYGYKTIDDYFNALVIDVDEQQYCSYMLAHQYIGEHNEALYKETLKFYQQIRNL